MWWYRNRTTIFVRIPRNYRSYHNRSTICQQIHNIRAWIWLRWEYTGQWLSQFCQSDSVMHQSLCEGLQIHRTESQLFAVPEEYVHEVSYLTIFTDMTRTDYYYTIKYIANIVAVFVILNTCFVFHTQSVYIWHSKLLLPFFSIRIFYIYKICWHIFISQRNRGM